MNFCKAGVDAGGEPDQTIANGATDFNPVWIRMILLLVSDLVKLGCIVNLNPQVSGACPSGSSALSLGAFRCRAHTQVRASVRRIDPASLLQSGLAHESRAQATGLICPAVPLPSALRVDWHSFSRPSLSGGRRLPEETSNVLPAFQQLRLGLGFHHLFTVT